MVSEVTASTYQNLKLQGCICFCRLAIWSALSMYLGGVGLCQHLVGKTRLKQCVIEDQKDVQMTAFPYYLMT
jgi:hypothetical protein